MSTRLLNPGEVEALVRDERERRRLLRLNQVRGRSRENATRVVMAVKNERRRQLQLLRQKLEDEWRRGKREKLDELGTQYGDCLLHVGDAHRSVIQHEKLQEGFSASQQQVETRAATASTRGREALAKLSAERAEVHKRILHRNSSRELVRRVEDERAKELASLPTPPSTVEPAKVHEQRGSPSVPVALDVSQDGTDAREAARAEEEKLQSDDAARPHRESAQSALEKERFLKAHAKMELQRNYNRIMDELEKIGEAEKSSDDFICQVDPDVKRRLLAEQEVLVEELLDKLSIPLVSAVSASASDSDQTPSYYLSDDESSIAVNHILVSVSSSSSSPSSAATDLVESSVIIPSNYKPLSRSVAVNTETSISDSTPSVSERRQPRIGAQTSPPIDEQETILASHPNGYISSVGIDLSSYAFDDEESSTKWPQSTVQSISASHPEPVQLSSEDEVDQPPSHIQPIFRNVQVRRHEFVVDQSVTHDKDKEKLRDVDRSSYLRQLLRQAVKNRIDNGDLVPPPRPKSSSSASSRSPIAESGLADLKESFRKAQANLRAELETRDKKMEQLLLLHQKVDDNDDYVDEPRHRPQTALSTIPEVESSTSLVVVDDDGSPRQWPFALETENGITDEPDLTLVCSSETSSRAASSVPNTPLKVKTPDISKRPFLFLKAHSGTSTIPFRDSSTHFSTAKAAESKFWTPSFSSSSSNGDSWSSCLSNRRRTLRKPLSTLDLSESSDASTSLPTLTSVSQQQKHICLSGFFDTTSDEASCPICQSSISDSGGSTAIYARRALSQKVTSSSSPSSTSDDSLNSFLKHELSANISIPSGANTS